MAKKLVLTKSILIINTGSSTIKASIFCCHTLTLMHHHTIEYTAASNYSLALCDLLDWYEKITPRMLLTAVGHRVVHGGMDFMGPTQITAEVIKKIAALTPLAPLHQAHTLEAIHLIAKRYPKLLQIACFDTAFHHTQHRLAKLFAIPKAPTTEGIIRYGFHGISYEYIASVLPEYLHNNADRKIIVAHLGNGASMCAMLARKSIATSMGFTALDGLMMGTRCGSLDPGVILYLLQEKKMSIEAINHLLYHESGLLGVSGISGDMRELLSSTHRNAIEAVELFCYRAASQLSALCAALQGCDAIIFTAGIGENAPIIRKKICDQLQWLGVVLNEHANQQHASIISDDKSRVLVGIIPTDEALMIAKHVHNMIKDLIQNRLLYPAKKYYNALDTLKNCQ